MTLGTNKGVSRSEVPSSDCLSRDRRFQLINHPVDSGIVKTARLHRDEQSFVLASFDRVHESTVLLLDRLGIIHTCLMQASKPTT